MSSLRYRAGVAEDTIPGVEVGGDFRLPRDPAVDRTTPQGFADVGLAGNPDPPAVLGAQTSSKSSRTPTGRPGFFRLIPFRPQARSLDREERGTLAPGTIRRNVRYATNGQRGQGFFSWAANAIGEAVGFVPLAKTDADEYLVSSLHLQLPDSLATVVSGFVKESPGLEPFRQTGTVQAGASTGWPVLAPQIPSYGSRVPLRRPRGIATAETGS